MYTPTPRLVQGRFVMYKREKKYNILSSQLRAQADQMPGPPREGQLISTMNCNDVYALSKHAPMNRATPMMSSCHMKRVMA